MRPVSPFEAFQTGFEMAQLAIEAQAVIWMRTLGLGGAWNTPFDEGYRMWREKPQAITEAVGRSAEAALAGHPPERVLSAAIAPLSREAALNRQRLADRGAARW